MRRSIGSLAVYLAIAAAGASDAAADTIFEVEHARATARVGGPVSDRDAELLDRWGAHSGTPDWRRRRSETDAIDAPRQKRTNGSRLPRQ